jgi:DNA polymerase III subunit gamma/tau
VREHTVEAVHRRRRSKLALRLRPVSYLVLARKYRPQSFDDLIGQEHVAQTLANAIAQDRVAHAFLFTGVRGVGKTTSARILAKCLNCLGADGKAKGPTAKPCQQCAACTEIAAGMDMDVQEIDAASYNGVDEVRRLQEGLAFRPARDRFKIYIVDEVHMLSNAAWNAFLKTLEEPPPHVKFIFATTEVHKVPVTILSRCQRYDFKLVSARQIGARLKDVVTKENLKADDAAISVLAREAAGSMRDAMSLADQVIAYGAEKITADIVAKVLGVADREILQKLTGSMLAGDAGTALSVLDQTARQGFDMVHLWKDLMRHVRNLVVAKVMTNEAQTKELLDLAEEEAADVITLAQKSDADDLTRIFTGLSRGFDDIVKSGQVRSNLEMTLVRLARRPALLPLDELLSRLGELEKRLASGAPPPTRGGGGGGGGGRSTRSGGAPSPEPASITSDFAPPTFAAPVFTPPQPAVVMPSPVSSSISVPSVPSAARSSDVRGSLALEIEPPVTARNPPVEHFEVKPAVAPPVSSSSSKSPESDTVTTWRKILERVRVASPPVAAMLDLAVPMTVSKDKLVIGIEDESFEQVRSEQTDAKAVLTTAAQAFFRSASTEIVFERAAKGSKLGGSVAYLDAAKRKQAQVEARQAVENHELVQRAIMLFDAELKDVKLPAQDD